MSREEKSSSKAAEPDAGGAPTAPTLIAESATVDYRRLSIDAVAGSPNMFVNATSLRFGSAAGLKTEQAEEKGALRWFQFFDGVDRVNVTRDPDNRSALAPQSVDCAVWRRDDQRLRPNAISSCRLGDRANRVTLR